MNKQSVLGILACMAALVSRLGLSRMLPAQRVWRSLTGSKLLGDIVFRFDAEVSGTRFQLQGPFRYAADAYYIPYLTQGAYEAAVTAHITQVVRQCPNPRVMDVGAHYGWYTIYLAKVIGNRGTVFSFEPSKAIFSFLERNVELNDLHNVRLYQLPLSDKRETIRMVVSKSYPRESRYMSIIERGATDNSTGTFQAIPFDKLNEVEAIRPNIVKIDVRSVWRKVVDGMKESLYREVKHLYLELDTPSNDLSLQYADIQHVILMLRDAGMDVYEIQDFTKRDGGKMVEADENRIAGRDIVMLYGVKKR